MPTWHEIPILFTTSIYKFNGDNDLISKWDVEIDYVLVMNHF